MSEGFRVGEIAILINTTHFHEYEGSDCEIKQLMSPLESICMNELKAMTKLRYKIELPDGMRLNAGPHQLKKKRSPGEEDVKTETKTEETHE